MNELIADALKWKDSADVICWDIRPFIDGRYHASSSTELLENVNPSTEEILCEFSVGDGADIDRAVRSARRRFDDGSWSELPPVRRAEILLKLADLIVKHGEELALLDSLEMGRPIRSTLLDAQKFAPRMLRSWAGFADKLVGACAPMVGASVYLNAYEPRGVVGAITPWNFPLVNAVFKFGPALAAGNTVVLKPSELAPSSALKLAELALEAGMPEGVLNVVPGLGATVGAALAQHADVDMLSFTGSTATGRRIMELSARSNGKPLLLECGGKSPQVVFDDVENLETVADAVVQSALSNQGQVCSAHTRLLAQETIKEALLDRVVKRASSYRASDPLDQRTTFGPLASPAQRDRVKFYVEAGLKDGAVPVLKGAIQDKGGCFVWPTIFDRVDMSMSIVREEIFGPVLCVQSFKTEEEAVALANGTCHGLAATIWTTDFGRGKRLAREIRAGYVAVRTSGRERSDSGCVLGCEPQKTSGFGMELGIDGLRAYSTLKSVMFKGE
jgi:acyl-CoA reductase-like NAD-dependent aldehyde dehydrogenase